MKLARFFVNGEFPRKNSVGFLNVFRHYLLRIYKQTSAFELFDYDPP
jgi:hypothetical protein